MWLRFETRRRHAGLIRCDAACLLLRGCACHSLSLPYALRNRRLPLRGVLRHGEWRGRHDRTPNCKRTRKLFHATHTVSPSVNVTPVCNLSGLGKHPGTRVAETAFEWLIFYAPVQQCCLRPHEARRSASLIGLILAVDWAASRWTWGQHLLDGQRDKLTLPPARQSPLQTQIWSEDWRSPFTFETLG